MKWKYIAFALLAAVVVSAGAAVAWAHGSGSDRMFGHHMGWIARQLDLTDPQKTQVKSMIDAERPTLAPLLRQLATTRQQMLAATANGKFDQEKVQALANQQSQIIAQLIVEKEKLISHVYQNVLTPEQRTKADALRQRMTEHINQRLQKFESRGATTNP
jgi:protein CpxP